MGLGQGKVSNWQPKLRNLFIYTMKVVVGLCAVLPFTSWALLTGPWLLNLIKLTAFTAGDETNMDRSFPSCTIKHVHQQRQYGCFRDGIQRSNRVWICCCSLMKSWLIVFFSCDQAALQMVFSVRLSVCPSVRLSVRLSHLFDYVSLIVSSWNFQELLLMTKVRSMQKVKVRGQRSRSQRSQPNLTVSGL